MGAQRVSYQVEAFKRDPFRSVDADDGIADNVSFIGEKPLIN